jgi:glycosyltransferase involved in cell wall biosynthesis
LVIAGPKAWGTETKLLAQDIDKGVYGKRVRRLNYVPLPTLVSLIRGAKATLFPSLYEGFGLPVLESMQLGTPVLSSDVSSIPEVAGDAALLVNPYNTGEIRDGILALDANPELRAELVARGRKRAEVFGMQRFRLNVHPAIHPATRPIPQPEKMPL